MPSLRWRRGHAHHKMARSWEACDMVASWARVTVCGLVLLATTGSPPGAAAAVLPIQLAQQAAPAPTYPAQQLDQMLAPIALYPDPLLAQIMMAATYPLEVVEAERWVQDPNNSRLRGDALDAALQQQAWDPSVKSLVPFPQILVMMDSHLDWTQALGNAFLAQQAAVMDSVQRLRAQAQAAGTLQSTPQETVSADGSNIVIEPANPQQVYVPYYNSASAYGSWAYPDYPPTYFPPPPGYGYSAGPGIYFGIGVGVLAGLWGWNHWDWAHHDIAIDAGRYNRINNYAIAHDHRPAYTGTTWQHDPAHRVGVPYANAAVQQKFQRAPAGSVDARRDFRGFVASGGVPGTSFGATVQGSPAQRGAAPIGERRAAAPTFNAVARPVAPRPVAPAFSSVGRGAEVRVQSQRGQASRQSMVRAAAPAPRSAPAGGNRGGGSERGRR
jgi:hypothetical protein